MKTALAVCAPLALALVAGPAAWADQAAPAAGQSAAEKYLGEHEMCLDSVRTKRSYVLDNQTILFDANNGTVYINRLPARCPGLNVQKGFAYDSFDPRLCKQEIITVIQTFGPGATCGIGDFVELKGVKSIEEGRRLLKDEGVLDQLVAEKAFPELFPKKTDGATP